MLPFFACQWKIKNPNPAWESGFYRLLLFFKVVPPVLLRLNFNQSNFIDLAINVLFIKYF